MKVLFLDTVHPLLSERLSAAGLTCIDATGIPAMEGVNGHADATGIVLRGVAAVLAAAVLAEAVLA